MGSGNWCVAMLAAYCSIACDVMRFGASCCRHGEQLMSGGKEQLAPRALINWPRQQACFMEHLFTSTARGNEGCMRLRISDEFTFE